jgi:hypothetical protein
VSSTGSSPDKQNKEELVDIKQNGFAEIHYGSHKTSHEKIIEVEFKWGG